MEKYNVILFLILSFWIFKYKSAQETTAKQSSSDARVIGLLVGFFSLLGIIAIFVAIWCYCCHYENNKAKEKLSVRNVSVKPMVLSDKTPPTTAKPHVGIDNDRAIEEQKAHEIVSPVERRDQTDDTPKGNNNEEDEAQLESYRQ